MALSVCQQCTTRFAVGLLACPHCRSTEFYEEGSDMPKITVHGGPSNAAAGLPIVVGETVPEPVLLPEDAAVVPVAEVVEFTGEPAFEPLPEVVDSATVEHESVPDYEAWTVVRLREVLASRELATSGTKPELIQRLRDADAEESSDG